MPSIITEIESEAEFVCINGHETGRALWSAIECAMEAGLPARKARRVFDSMLEGIVDDMPASASALFSANAYDALPIASTSTIERAEINSNLRKTYADFCEAMKADKLVDAEYQAADFRADQRRDEQRGAA